MRKEHALLGQMIALQGRGYSYGEIGRHLGTSRNVVAGALFRAGLSGPLSVEHANRETLPRPKGEQIWNHKVTEAIVRQIRADYRRGTKERGLAALGDRHGISFGAVSRIINGKCWAHVQ